VRIEYYFGKYPRLKAILTAFNMIPQARRRKRQRGDERHMKIMPLLTWTQISLIQRKKKKAMKEDRKKVDGHNNEPAHAGGGREDNKADESNGVILDNGAMQHISGSANSGKKASSVEPHMSERPVSTCAPKVAHLIGAVAFGSGSPDMVQMRDSPVYVNPFDANRESEVSSVADDALFKI
jgi:hypothetical protein